METRFSRSWVELLLLVDKIGVLNFVHSLQKPRSIKRMLFHPVNQGQRRVYIGVTPSDSLTHSAPCSHSLLTRADTMWLLALPKEERLSTKLSCRSSGEKRLFFISYFLRIFTDSKRLKRKSLLAYLWKLLCSICLFMQNLVSYLSEWFELVQTLKRVDESLYALIK
jgi:hypothetical protein